MDYWTTSTQMVYKRGLGAAQPTGQVSTVAVRLDTILSAIAALVLKLDSLNNWFSHRRNDLAGHAALITAIAAA
ncbi:hypothetical protein UNDYM_0586 [Undibacterium sp. YM2]|nr:hypothetical protein UNDYM_0586 [Undibacterium sp. YM2]